MSITRPACDFGNGANAFFALLLLLATALAPAGAWAQYPGTGGRSAVGAALPSGGWYSGLSTGRSHIGMRESAVPATGASLSALSRVESDTAYKLYGGYQFNRNLTLEGGYADFGKFDARREIALPMFGTLSGDLRASGFYVGALGVVPLPNRFSLFGKLGTSYTSGTASVSTGGVMLPLLTPADLSSKRTEWNAKYGLGASYEMSNKMGLRFEYERINSFGDGRLGEGNVGVWSLGLTKRY